MCKGRRENSLFSKNIYVLIHIAEKPHRVIYVYPRIFMQVCVNICVDSRLLLFARLINWLLKVLKIENKI